MRFRQPTAPVAAPAAPAAEAEPAAAHIGGAGAGILHSADLIPRVRYLLEGQGMIEQGFAHPHRINTADTGQGLEIGGAPPGPRWGR